MRDDQGPNGPEDDVIADLPGATGCPPGHRPFALAATILGSSMAFIDGTTVQVALPSIQSNLDAAFSQLQWTVNGYTLTLGALLLTAGALGDQVGRRRVFSAGVMLFAASSIACALAPNAAVLIFSRIV
ncbi:MAG: MFS transporter, partial [Ectothiorhodospiraceae bacterium]